MPRAVILTALPVEYLAVRNHLIELQENIHPQGTIYEEGKFVVDEQAWEVRIAEIGSGNTGAAVETVRAIADFQPDTLLFVGIAGGIKNVKIGDVVAATDVYGYESGKVGKEFFPRPKVGKSAYGLVQRAKSEARKQEWLQRLSSNPKPKPSVFVAPIAAGEKVVASKQSDIFQFLRASYNDAIAVEMEGFVFLSAAFAYSNIQAIVIRGIFDLIEGKNDDAIEPEEVRQEKASHHASAFAFQVLSKFQVTDSPSTTNSSPASVQPLQNELDMNNLPIRKPREYVLDLLNQLLPSQLESVILRYDIEFAHLSNETPSQRSIELIRYALQKEGADLSQLLTVIYTVAPHMQLITEQQNPIHHPNQPPHKFNNKTYVERPKTETECYQTIVQPGALLRLKAPQHMGKTMLIDRVLNHARKQGYETVALSFELTDSLVFHDLKKFCQWFCGVVGDMLNKPNQLTDYWEDILGSKYNTTSYFQKYLLAETTKPLVLALDHVDLVFEHTAISGDFCNLLRSWHDQAITNDLNSRIWQKLRLIIVHATDVYGSLDINSSPLGGVGLTINLPELNPEQLQDLAQQNGLNWNANKVKQLMSLVGGQPHLAQLAFNRIKYEDLTLERILQEAHTDAGIYTNHLLQKLAKLNKSPALATAFRKVVTQENPVQLDSALVFKLQGMGLIKLERNTAKVRCELYRRYFSTRLSRKD